MDGLETLNLVQLNTTPTLTIDDCTASFFDTIYDCSNRLDLNKTAIKKSGVCENTQNNITDNDMRSAVQQLCTAPSSRQLTATNNYPDLEFSEAISNLTQTPLQQYAAQKLFKCEELANKEADIRIETHPPTGFIFAYYIGIIALISSIPLLGISALACKKNCIRPSSDQEENMTTNDLELTVSTSTESNEFTQHV